MIMNIFVFGIHQGQLKLLSPNPKKSWRCCLCTKQYKPIDLWEKTLSVQFHYRYLCLTLFYTFYHSTFQSRPSPTSRLFFCCCCLAHPVQCTRNKPEASVCIYGCCDVVKSHCEWHGMQRLIEYVQSTIIFLVFVSHNSGQWRKEGRFECNISQWNYVEMLHMKHLSCMAWWLNT